MVQARRVEVVDRLGAWIAVIRPTMAPMPRKRQVPRWATMPAYRHAKAKQQPDRSRPSAYSPAVSWRSGNVAGLRGKHAIGLSPTVPHSAPPRFDR